MIGVDSVAAGSVPEGTVTAVMVAAMASSFLIGFTLCMEIRRASNPTECFLSFVFCPS